MKTSRFLLILCLVSLIDRAMRNWRSMPETALSRIGPRPGDQNLLALPLSAGVSGRLGKSGIWGNFFGISRPHLVEGPESRPEVIDSEVINHFDLALR